MDQKMFCYQCQETAGCKGCTVVGVCGKQPDVAAMQDLLVWVTKGISAVTTRLREEGRAVADEVNHLVTENLFTTITNANFDKAAIEKRIEKTLEMKTALWEQLERRDNLPEAAGWTGEPSEFIKKASEAGVLIGQNEDIISLRSLITYGLKGLSAYTRHANVLLQEDREADAFLQRALAATLGVIAPSLVLIMLIAAFISNFIELSAVSSAFAGIRACVCVLIGSAVVKLAKKSLVDKGAIAIAAVVFVLSLFTSVSPALLVVVAGAIGIVLKGGKGEKK
mgnify:CR=1 FL=1